MHTPRLIRSAVCIVHIYSLPTHDKGLCMRAAWTSAPLFYQCRKPISGFTYRQNIEKLMFAYNTVRECLFGTRACEHFPCERPVSFVRPEQWRPSYLQHSFSRKKHRLKCKKVCINFNYLTSGKCINTFTHAPQTFYNVNDYCSYYCC